MEEGVEAKEQILDNNIDHGNNAAINSHSVCPSKYTLHDATKDHWTIFPSWSSISTKMCVSAALDRLFSFIMAFFASFPIFPFVFATRFSPIKHSHFASHDVHTYTLDNMQCARCTKPISSSLFWVSPGSIPTDMFWYAAPDLRLPFSIRFYSVDARCMHTPSLPWASLALIRIE